LGRFGAHLDFPLDTGILPLHLFLVGDPSPDSRQRMARSDLLLSLVRAGATGDKSMLRNTVEALAADERAKRHGSLAEQLTRALNSAPSSTAVAVATNGQPNGKDFLLEVIPKRSLSSLILADSTRRAVEELIEEHHRSDLLRSHGMQPRHRILLAGPPGNGKTSLAEALADALAIPFFTVRYDLLIGSYLGETTQRLRRLFDYVRTTPCVLLFDEFDVVGKERGDPHETGEIKRVVSTLLLQIDALPSYVVVVAATNHGELLDRAAWRRFELRLQLPAPTSAELALYLDMMLAFKDQNAALRPLSGSLLAKKLGAISYAEARDFCLDINRRFILSLNQKKLSDIVVEQLKVWSERAGGPHNGKGSIEAASPAKGDSRNKAHRSRQSRSLPRRT
jgi:ATPase family associated with various cellular activities (AAA)